MKKHWRYLKYVFRHKVAVFRAACRLGIPWLGIIHDLSKFRPDEWNAYATSFYGPWPYKERPQHIKDAFDRAWLLHIHRNRHHPQFWCLRNDTDGVTFLEMPERYVREMVADWMGAGMAIRGHGMAAAPRETLTWWQANQAKSGYAMHPKTAALVERLLASLREQQRA